MFHSRVLSLLLGLFKGGRAIPEAGTNDTTTSKLCSRCDGIDLNFLLNLEDTKSQEGDAYSTALEERVLLNLGPFWSFLNSLEVECPLCRIFLNLLPDFEEDYGDDDDLYVLRTRTLHRFEPGALIRYSRDHGPSSSNLLYLGHRMLRQGQTRLPYCHEVLNAVGRDALHSERVESMTARRVNPYRVDVDLIKLWVDACEKNHSSACVIAESDLSKPSRLIDVAKRLVVSCPQQPVQYLCLSYVWGSAMQPAVTYRAKLKRLPATIENAMQFVLMLGQRYLWVDSICINQSDDEDKRSQIAIMNDIYRGSWLTIVALDGASVNSGLPRTQQCNRVSHQKEEIIRGTRFLTVMSTLDQQVRSSKWATRAWTYQEALLSPRCVYFTDEQVYFECNTFQCCESIDETHSPFHTRPHTERQELARGSSCHHKCEAHFIGEGVFRDPACYLSNVILEEKLRLVKYNELICNYSARDMTYPGDALKACNAILQRLHGRAFKEGFYWGLPTQAFQVALLWSHKGKHSTRPGFPSWSWLGWQGELESAVSITEGRPKSSEEYSPPFRAWKKISGTEYTLLYKNPELEPIHRKEEDSKPNIIYDAAYAPVKPPEFDIGHIPASDLCQMIFVQALLFQPELQKQASSKYAKIRASSFDCIVNGVTCTVECFNIYTAMKMEKEVDMLLVDRVRWDWSYDFILLDWVGEGPSKIGDEPEQSKFRARRSGRVRLWPKSHQYFYGYWKLLDELFTRDNTHLIFISIE